MPSWSDHEVALLEAKYPTGQKEVLENELDRNWHAIRTKANRLGVSRHPQYRLIQSIREAPDTPVFEDEAFNNYIVGFVDGEGTFVKKSMEDRPLQHRFSIELEEKDAEILEEICSYFGVGNVQYRDARKDAYSPTVEYNVQNFGELVSVIVPFFQQYPPRTPKKRAQFGDWRVGVEQRMSKIESFK